MLRAALPLVLAVAGCDRVFGLDERPLPIDAGIEIDGPPEAIAGTPFGEVVEIFPGSGLEEDRPTLTGDMLELYFHRGTDIWRSVRATTEDPWPPPQLASELNSAATDIRPCLSSNGLTIYFSRTVTSLDLFVATRPVRTEPWSVPRAVSGDINQPGVNKYCGWPSPDDRLLFYVSDAGGNAEIYRATRPTPIAPFASVLFSELNSATNEGPPWAMASGTVVVFNSSRDTGNQKIFEAIQDGFVWTIQRRTELDSTASEGSLWLSPDGRVVFFSSARDGEDDIFMATRGM